MRKVVYVLALALVMSSTAFAQKKNKNQKEDKKEYQFTLVKENPVTSVKDQNRSGTCWTGLIPH